MNYSSKILKILCESSFKYLALASCNLVCSIWPFSLSNDSLALRSLYSLNFFWIFSSILSICSDSSSAFLLPISTLPSILFLSMLFISILFLSTLAQFFSVLSFGESDIIGLGGDG